MTYARAFFIGTFFASILAGPWWLSVILAVLLLSFAQSYIPVLAGGALLDALFGAPIPALFNIPFLFTIIFAILAASAYYLHRRVLE